LEQELQAWMDNLPDNLKLDSQEKINVAPAHLLSLQMQWECAMIAVQVPL
jgi:hypothetical protein